MSSLGEFDQVPTHRPPGRGSESRRSLDPPDALSDPHSPEASQQPRVAGSDDLSPASRRRFLQLMGASFALAGASGCLRWPEQTLAPHSRAPDNRAPGVPVTYTTAIDIGGVAQGLVATSYDGRPIKIEGNPAHPLNSGAADAFAQAGVLGLYDPDRSRGVIRREAGSRSVSSWEQFQKWAHARLRDDGPGPGARSGAGAGAGAGAGFAVLGEVSSSPSLAHMQALMQKAMPKAQWFHYEPVGDDNIREGHRQAFGVAMQSVLDLSQARVIVALDADLLGGGHPLAVKYARDFAAGRRLHEASDESMNRLYVAEPVYTVTGACADHRLAVRASAIAALAAQLAGALGVAGAPSLDSSVDRAFLDAMVADLRANPGRAVVAAGARQPAEVHALVAAINHKLENVGRSLVYYPDPQPQRPSHLADMRALAAAIGNDKVQTLLILGGNPVYNAPADLRFAELLRRVPESVHLGLYEDETSQQCTWHLSRTHEFEAWGDVRAFDGAVSIVQPLIEPLFDGRSPLELLSLLLGEKAGPERDGYPIVRRTVGSLVGESFSEWTWKKALFDGVVAGTSVSPVSGIAVPGIAAPRMPQSGALAGPAELPPGCCEVVFFPDTKVYDGRFANNGWLQEWPDPMTRLTWDNAALMSAETAAALGAKPDELVSLEAAGREPLTVPVLLLPGMPRGVIGLALGYGRRNAGSVGNGVGKNAYALRAGDGMGWTTNVAVHATGVHYPLATVQDHHIVDRLGKEAVQHRIPEMIREGTFTQYRHDPSLAVAKPALLSPFDEHSFDGRPGVGVGDGQSSVAAHTFHKWGMAVDLTACVGCGACVVACQAENNIPIVGKEQVLHGREMHWLRIDRYFRETAGVPRAVHQPVACMHCENAPCEQVCPVAATTHSREGINMMTYNRCVGTRYCANNCPYKVRRFNYFDYNRGTLKDLYVPNLAREAISELQRMQKNPEVTVRMRGVMEKCTFCIQRIEKTRIAAKREGDRPILDGEIQTACQQTCPAKAIAFGDLNDPNSRVSKLQRLTRTYGMLSVELNTKPRTQYVAKVRNPSDGLDAALDAKSTER